MSEPSVDELTTVQRTALVCVQAEPGRWSRSGLAKLLAGSQSPRSASLSDHPDFGRLAGRGRKALTFEIDILLQQGFLALDAEERLIPSG